jgi:hypothetical protein
MKALMSLAMALALLGAGVARADAPPSDASIRKLLEVTQSSKLLDGMTVQMKSIMQQSALQAVGHSLDAQEQQILSRNIDKLADVMRNQMTWAKLEPAIMVIYRKNFSQKEIDDMLVFYQSPTGQTLVSKMPEVMRESMQMGRDQMSGVFPQIQQINRQMMQEIKDYEASKSKGTTSSAGTSEATPPADPSH